MVTDILIGRRAVHTRITREYDSKKKEMVEVKREQFRGSIVALVVVGQYNHSAVVMLYDSGALCEHSLDSVTVEGGTVEGVYR